MTPQVQQGRGQAEGPTGREVSGASSEHGSLEAPGAGAAGEATWGPGPDDSVKARTRASFIISQGQFTSKVIS